MTGWGCASAAACLLLAVWAVPAAAQGRYPVRSVAFIDVGGQLSVTAKFFEENQTNQDTGLSLTYGQNLFNEDAELKAHGYVYHPNLVEWFATTRFGLEQDRETTTGSDLDADGTNVNFDFSALILREKTVSFRVFAVRMNNDVERNVGAPFKFSRSNFGLEAFLRGPIGATVLIERLHRIEDDQTRDETETTGHYRLDVADRRDPAWLTELSLDHENSRETATIFGADGEAIMDQDLSYRATEFRLSNRWQFGPERRHLLAGGLRVYQRQGFYPNDAVNAHQRLELGHSETFSTYYSLRYTIDNTDQEDETQWFAEVGFLKKIYDSLDISSRLYIRNRTFRDGDEKIHGGEIDLAYRKETPIGLYASSLGLGRERERETSDSGVRAVVGEAVTLTGTTFEALTNPNVVAASVRVFKADRTFEYQNQVHFVLDTFGSFTRIRRVPGAPNEITDGQTVLVDYSVDTSAETEFTTDNIRWSHRLKLKHVPVSVYFSYDLQDRSLVSGEDPGNLERRSSWIAGARWDHEGLSVGIEHEEEDQQLSPPTVETTFDARYRRRLGRDVSIGAGTRVSRLRYLQAREFDLAPGRDFRDSFALYANMTAKLTKNTLLRFNTDYDRALGADNTWGVTVGGGFEWKVGDLDFSIRVRHNTYRQESTIGTERRVFISVSRRF